MIRFGLTAALVLGLAGAAYAQGSTDDKQSTPSTPSTTDQSQQSASPQSAPSTTASSAKTGNQLEGRVESVDRSNNILTLSGSDKAIHVDASTDIVKDGAKASLTDIKEGDQVRASFQPSATGEVLHAQRLEVMKGVTGTVKEKATKEKSSTEKSTPEKKY